MSEGMPTYDAAIAKVEALRSDHDVAGKKLFEICSGNIFPCHALYLSVLNRSLGLLNGFCSLAKERNYECSAAIVRMQLDNVLRFNGVLNTQDPHRTANEIFNGVRLNKMKSKAGKKLQDAHLVSLLADKNPWVQHVYEVASGYIHLSSNHMWHFLESSELVPDEPGERKMYLAPSSGHVPEKHQVEVVVAFEKITKAVFLLLDVWIPIAADYSIQQLKETYELIT